MYITRSISLFVAALSVTSAKAAPPASPEPLERRIAPGGTATFYSPNGDVGACGTVQLDTNHVVALPTTQYANGAQCGRNITITDTSTGKTAVGTVADECLSCSSGSIDLSVSFFELFAPTNVGVFPVAWHFNAQ
ncbi:hypothetical protein M422DRAFT_267572 [Sphaerobolus stellatus SS14]|uniref:RlpA-like protein double-psi beta-barrel domain-containing protein n=1 Tax=Sphaerobolus stellatus (strain SS14) TaxID=990650 RepID=A0A0C9UPJ2_SPHS4|nr:hypothetical protein M422DRAFT_267572 [Sphaerobolus stellatus SS14]